MVTTKERLEALARTAILHALGDTEKALAGLDDLITAKNSAALERELCSAYRTIAMRTLLANTEDAYQFPPFRQLAPSVVIGGEDHAELRRKERAVLKAALEHIRCRWISTPDFSWADEIPRTLADDAQDRQRHLSSA